MILPSNIEAIVRAVAESGHERADWIGVWPYEGVTVSARRIPKAAVEGRPRAEVSCTGDDIPGAEFAKEPETDGRGFAVYDQLEDSYGARVAVKESSAAAHPHAWIFVEGGAIRDGDNKGSAHLDVAQARRVHAALGRWLADVDEQERTL